MGKIIDGRKIHGIKKRIESFKKNLNNEKQKIISKNLEIMKNDFESMIDNYITIFYDSYNPRFYNRYGDLYNVYKITINKNNYSIDFDSSYMMYDHRVSNEYIYQNSFINGYHGGAISGIGHPDVGTPYYRKPFPNFTEWGREAVKSNSIFDQIKNEAGFIIKKTEENVQNDFDKMFVDFKNQIKDSISEL